MTLQAEGSYAKAKAMIDTLGVIRPETKRVLDRLADVPVDIEPRFTTARAVAAARDVATLRALAAAGSLAARVASQASRSRNAPSISAACSPTAATWHLAVLESGDETVTATRSVRGSSSGLEPVTPSAIPRCLRRTSSVCRRTRLRRQRSMARPSTSHRRLRRPASTRSPIVDLEPTADSAPADP